jgi:hypothetical protein
MRAELAEEAIDSGLGLRLAVGQQAELLAMLAGSIRAGSEARGLEIRPLDTVRLADLDQGADAPDPLLAFGAVATCFAQQAERVVDELGGRGYAA